MTVINFNLVPFHGHTDDIIAPISISGSLEHHDAKIDICYRITGETEKINIPAVSSTPDRKDLLWKHTCLEFFVTEPQLQMYWEYNLSPTHDWAIYGFSAYRHGQHNALPEGKIVIETSELNQHSFELRSQLPLPGPLHGKNLQVGISAIIQDFQNTIYYYALIHSGQTPDFHDRNSFTLMLDVGS